MEQDLSSTKPTRGRQSAKPSQVQRQYPAVIKICREAHEHGRKADGYPWRIGKALNDAVGLPGPVGVNDESGIKMSECSKELKDEGLGEDYSLAYLKKCRTTYANFPDEKRLASVPWAVHCLAGTPDTLAKMLKKAEDDGKRLTTTVAKNFLAQRNNDDKAKAQKENKDNPDSALRNCIAKAKEARTSAKDLVDLASNAETLITPHLPNITERKKLIDAITSARDDVSKAVAAWDKFLQTVNPAVAA